MLSHPSGHQIPISREGYWYMISKSIQTSLDNHNESELNQSNRQLFERRLSLSVLTPAYSGQTKSRPLLYMPCVFA